MSAATTTYRDTTHPNHAAAALDAFAASSGGVYASNGEMVRDLISAALRLATTMPGSYITISQIAEKCGQQAIEDQADAAAGALIP